MTADAATRDRILAVASRLFYAHGVRAVGTSQVIDAAGTGKKVLYQHFPSKDDLVACYLDLVSRRRTASTARAVAAAGDDPADQLVAVVAEVADRVREPDFRGCAFRNYLVEFPTAGPPGSPAGIARAYLLASRTVLDERAGRLGSPDRADRLWLLVDALYLQAAYRDHLRQDPDVAVRLAREIVS